MGDNVTQAKGLTVCQESVLQNLPQLHLPQPLHPLQPQPPPLQQQPQRIVTRRLASYVRISSTASPGSAAARTPAPASLTGAQCAKGPTWHLVTPALQQTREVLVTVLVLISALTMSVQHQMTPVSSLSM